VPYFYLHYCFVLAAAICGKRLHWRLPFSLLRPPLSPAQLTPSSTRGVVNDALAICFADATLASAFVARWCAMQRVEIVDGVYQVRNDEPTPRIGTVGC
jgi:hypothetical protein